MLLTYINRDSFFKTQKTKEISFFTYTLNRPFFALIKSLQNIPNDKNTL